MRHSLTINTESVQGEGSYVILKPPPWSVARELLYGLNAQPGMDVQAQGLAILERMLPLCVVEWNWKDEHGAELPLPADASKLTLDEMLFLVQPISGFLTPAKN